MDCEDYHGVEYFEQQQLIALLVDAGANPNATLDTCGLVIPAVNYIDLVGALNTLLEKGADPNTTDEKGNSALHYLGFPVHFHKAPFKTGLHEVGIRLLLKHKASVSHENKSGETPIHRAASGSNLRILELYLSAYPSEERNAFIRSKNRYGETLLHFAAAGCNIDNIEYLLSDGGMQGAINDASSNGWTPFMCAFAQTADRFGCHTRHTKGRSQIPPVARLLLSHGADPLVTTTEGWTPLHGLALFFGESISDETTQLIETLISAGADINARALFPVEDLSNSSRRSGYDCQIVGWGHQVEELIKDPSSHRMIIRSGVTPLHVAAAHGAVGVVEALLRHGANPATYDSSGASPASTAGDSTLLKNHVGIQDKIITLLMSAGGSY
ncbi:hypothetical protein G7Z17_g1072 [Cylindrodendrum hubeiense]|uniref:Uncharacterized protein n=1 Tax=Cylindrodendrum hubeiense TaxID=595255 RepID=A0A9P5HLK1_9HYPO|nr:hypothetical protein G7Z17_g1072 [Cylindrodendrum hubeiense]